MSKFTRTRPDPNDVARGPAPDAGEAAIDQEHLALRSEGAIGPGAVRLVDELEAPAVDILEDPAPAERLAELELALDSLGAALDAVNDRLSGVEKLEGRITHLEARTRDATVNADIVSLQGKVTGLEGNVGAVHAPALEELRTRVDALEART